MTLSRVWSINTLKPMASGMFKPETFDPNAHQPSALPYLCWTATNGLHSCQYTLCGSLHLLIIERMHLEQRHLHAVCQSQSAITSLQTTGPAAGYLWDLFHLGMIVLNNHQIDESVDEWKLVPTT